MTAAFDSIVIVDWSAPDRRPTDAVRIGVAGQCEEAPGAFPTREAALDWLVGRLVAAHAAGRRALVGFDFPFGSATGLAEALTGEASALAIWEHLAEWSGDGPERAAQDEHGLAGRRIVEARVLSDQPGGTLFAAGPAGERVLTGLSALVALRRDPALAGAIAVWPFETGLARGDKPIMLAEVYPSLLRTASAEGAIRDEEQVREAARALAALDREGALAPLFLGPPDLDAGERERVVREEGWILGVGHEAVLRAAARPAVPPLRNDCFAMPPGVDWVPVAAALAKLREELSPVAAPETLPLGAAGGRILAEPVVARRSHPPGPNAAVDGYGFAHAALGASSHVLPLAEGRAAAGVPYPGEVPPGQAIRILTGAPLPVGVDTVVLEEDVARDGGVISFARGLRRGANTRAGGEDVEAGAEILPAGHRLRPQDLALAAATGLGSLPVRRRLRVAVLSTGDEVVAPGAAAAVHQVHDANRPMLLEVLRRWDFEAVDLGHARDDPEALAAALDRGAGAAEALLTSGGASAGDEDHMVALLRRRGVLETWRIAVKPGRPLALGLWEGRPVFGLPGNPVAAFVCALVFARPALLRLAGAPWQRPRGFTVPAGFEKDKKAGRVEYLRARLTEEGAAEVFRSEGSGRVSGLVWAEGLVELDTEARRIRPGDPVRYLPFPEFGL